MNVQAMRSLRQYHHYLGIFFAPAIIFFAFSGALQTLGLHKANDWAGKPANWVMTIASIHKDQSLPGPKRPPRPRAVAAAVTDPRPSPVPLKVFVLFVALGLILTSTIGIMIALNNRAMRRVSVMCLIAGTVLPILFLFI